MLNPKDLHITPELLNKIEECSTPEELVQIAKVNNTDLTLDQAKQVLDTLDKDLTEDELAQVAGGVCWNDCDNLCYNPTGGCGS